jgi:hypothetical protein
VRSNALAEISKNQPSETNLRLGGATESGHREPFGQTIADSLVIWLRFEKLGRAVAGRLRRARQPRAPIAPSSRVPAALALPGAARPPCRPELHRERDLEPSLYAHKCANQIRTALAHLREAKDKRKTPAPAPQPADPDPRRLKALACPRPATC